MATRKPAAKKPTAKAPAAAKKPKARAPKPVVEEPAPTVGPTGLCLQCNKPADHKHVGV